MSRWTRALCGTVHEWEAPPVGTVWRQNKRAGNKGTTTSELYCSKNLPYYYPLHIIYFLYLLSTNHKCT
jgi:hypothetical protein